MSEKPIYDFWAGYMNQPLPKGRTLNSILGDVKATPTMNSFALWAWTKYGKEWREEMRRTRLEILKHYKVTPETD